MEGFTFVEKSVYVCGRFTLLVGFTFDGVTCVTGGVQQISEHGLVMTVSRFLFDISGSGKVIS